VRNAIAALFVIAALSFGGAAIPTTGSADRPSPFPLALPIACEPGIDCWVINHVDLDPGPGRRDYRCGEMSYDGHKGTDIALRDLTRLDEDVPVLASAAGRVVGVRDGEPDAGLATSGREAIRGKECGNGVRIQHADGWATQYCHLKQGSVIVRPGDTVEAGQVLGAVGLSGMTEFPHVHLTVEKDGAVIDPFRGVDGGPICGAGEVPLWDVDARAALVDHAPILVDAAFATGPVEKADAEAGKARVEVAGGDAPALVVWSRTAGLERGDTIAVTITAPDGSQFLTDRWTADRTRIMQFRFAGKKRPAGGWQQGVYTGRVTLERAGREPRTADVSIRIGG
jgi:hypothetical protein